MTDRQITPQILIYPDMSLALAEQLLHGVRDAAAGDGMSVAAAVVDRGGQVVAVARMDGTPSCGVPLWGMSTALGGRMVVYPGGLPLFHDGQLVGLGVSGAEGHQDRSYAAASVRAAHLAESGQ
jgi:glc operon protein GlcG